ncbi:VOC family protein [Nesterenkonia flava]|uniref:VOC family protein n=1 Tax=Nesterenkonia flava TaxID=469799 RepID=A0ABU1FS81_9MICC|nr:VOC family protein [Nesterenkonia flava]MDR5711018.1 VOC family protein [Nesterenkonia flava]
MILCLPFLMFQGRAQEAIDHYLEAFPDAELLEILHHPEGTEIYDPEADADQDRPGSAHQTEASEEEALDDTASMEAVVDLEQTLVASAQLKIGGQVLMIQDSLVKHHFDFTPSTSIAVVVDTEDEFRRITDHLSEGGEFLMEPGDYDFAKNFTWVKDRFGVSWQINQPLGAPDPDVAPARAPEWTQS